MSTLTNYPPRGWTRSGHGWERRKPGSTNVMEWCADEVFHRVAATPGRTDSFDSGRGGDSQRDEVIFAPRDATEGVRRTEAWDGFFKPQATDFSMAA